jgi:hypothetical protein
MRRSCGSTVHERGELPHRSQPVELVSIDVDGQNRCVLEARGDEREIQRIEAPVVVEKLSSLDRDRIDAEVMRERDDDEVMAEIHEPFSFTSTSDDGGGRFRVEQVDT